MRSKDIFKLIISVVICELTGISGTVFTISSIPTWYATLNKPVLNPPGWLFAPVWTVLYLWMGMSLWLVWRSDSPWKKRAIWLFAAQLALNAVWTPIFFGAHSISGALIIILSLWVAIVIVITIFRKVSRPSAWLLVPYILWVSFAAYLNFSLWLLN